MTVLSIHDNEEFRISTQVDHSKSVKHLPFLDISKIPKLYNSSFIWIFDFSNISRRLKRVYHSKDVEITLVHHTVKVEQNRKLGICIWFMLDNVQTLAEIFENSETGYLLVKNMKRSWRIVI